jgi:hypothetical protein
LSETAKSEFSITTEMEGHNNYKEGEIYATSEGAGSVEGGTLVEGALDKDVGIFRIRGTRLGEYFLAAEKKSFISSGLRA